MYHNMRSATALLLSCWLLASIPNTYADFSAPDPDLWGCQFDTIPATKSKPISVKKAQVGKHLVDVKLTGDFLWQDPDAQDKATRLEIREIVPGVILYNEQDKGIKNLPGGFIPRKQTVPGVLEFYNSVGKRTATINITKSNPYVKSKNAKVTCENCYEGEIGFADPVERKKALALGTADFYMSSSPILIPSPDAGFVTLVYSLLGYKSKGGLLFEKKTIRVFDRLGKEVLTLTNSDLDIWNIEFLKGKYAIMNFGGHQDINNMADKLSKEGFAIYELPTKKQIYVEYAKKQSGDYNGAFVGGKYIWVSVNYLDNTSPDYYRDVNIIDIEQRTIYSRELTQSEVREYQRIVENGNTIEAGIGHLLDKFAFTKKRF